MNRFKVLLSRSLLLLCLGALLCAICGCGPKESDSADPDPHYYKGKDFAKKKLR